MASFRRYDTQIDNDYARAHRAIHRANEARARAMASPRSAAGHIRAAKLARVAGRLYMRTAKYDKVGARIGADDMFAQAIFHDRYAKKIARGEMGAPGSHYEMQKLVRHRRDPRPRHRKASAHRHRTTGAPTFAQQRAISRKIRLLVREGRSPKQAAAMAYRMAGIPPRPARRAKRSPSRRTR